MNDEELLSRGEDVLRRGLETLRHLTPDEWNRFKYLAMDKGWHTMDLSQIADARLLSMRYAVKFGDPRR